MVRSQDCETDAKARRELEDFAVSHLQYVWAYNGVVSAAHAALNPTADVPHGPHGRACFIDEHYKRDVIGAPSFKPVRVFSCARRCLTINLSGALDSESLVNLLLCNPTIILQKANRETPVTASYILYVCVFGVCEPRENWKRVRSPGCPLSATRWAIWCSRETSRLQRARASSWPTCTPSSGTLRPPPNCKLPLRSESFTFLPRGSQEA